MNVEYKCRICGEVHNDYPTLTYPCPDSYYWLSDEEKKKFNTYLDTNFCTIEYPEQTDRFIRVVLKQKIMDSELTLDYGFWVSLSEKSYNDYFSNFKKENHENQYFGWLDNVISEYNFEKSIPTTVITKKGNERPEIFPHSDFEHPFVKDYYQGITREEAEKRIHNMLANISN